jgi:hypothetical protein
VPQTAALLAYVNQQLAISLADVSGSADERGKLFTDVKGGTNRWDLKLPFSLIVQEALTTLLRVDSLLGDVLLGLVSQWVGKLGGEWEWEWE